jgi:flagellar hook-basal body complex protein FliE
MAMVDPVGLLGGGGIGGSRPPMRDVGASQEGQSGSFRDILVKNLDEVNKAQQEATRAVEDVLTGERTDVERVIDATRKADDAFRMLQALRNRVMEAYDEVKQMRV